MEKKETIMWGGMGMGFGSSYKLEGTDLNKQLFDAIMACDNEQIVKLIEQGANPNVRITKTSYSIGKTESVETSTALGFLINTQPSEYVHHTIPGHNNFDDQIQMLRHSIEREESRGRNKSNSRINDLDYKIQQLQEKQREYNRQQSEKIAEVNKENLEREQKIISTVELLLSMGYGPTLNGGIVAVSDNFIKDLKFKNLATYLVKARFVEKAVTKIMNDNRMFVDNEAYVLSVNKQTEYRNLDVHKEEMLEMLQNDSELNPQILNA